MLQCCVNISLTILCEKGKKFVSRFGHFWAIVKNIDAMKTRVFVTKFEHHMYFHYFHFNIYAELHNIFRFSYPIKFLHCPLKIVEAKR